MCIRASHFTALIERMLRGQFVLKHTVYIKPPVVVTLSCSSFVCFVRGQRYINNDMLISSKSRFTTTCANLVAVRFARPATTQME